jgi:1-acyl-sn-glycerol-3-phosphate acyltransferase
MTLRWHPRFTPPFYWFQTALARVLLGLVVRWEVHGREHLPRHGPLIIVSNHLNASDPPLLATAIWRRRAVYMAKIEIFQGWFGFLPRWYGGFPVRRFEADMTALLNAERLLRRGGVLGMFPEGTRSHTGALGVPRPGSALIALRSGAPVLPCVMVGTEQLRKPLSLLRRPRMSVRIGQPIAVPEVRRPTEEQVDDLTARIYAAMYSLLPEKYQSLSQPPGSARTEVAAPSV